jgi:transposase
MLYLPGKLKCKGRAMAETTLHDRVMIYELAQAGYKDQEIAERVGWSVPTVRKWRRRGQQAGRAGLSPPRGRPATGALGTYPVALREQLRVWREAHPGWGAKTLRAELARHPVFGQQPLPSQRSIARWLAEQGLTRRYEKQRALPHVERQAPCAPHVEWEMDACGYQRVPEVGLISLINLNEVYSRVRLMSYPCWVGQQRATRHPTTADYQLVLRLTFMDWGLPDRLAVDHDSVFYDNCSKSPFPTRYHLWLLALGVQLTFGRRHRPTDQAITERSHQLWTQQVLVGQTFASQALLFDALQQRREFLNMHLPCATLDDLPPLVACPQARTPRRLYRPEWEAERLTLSPVYDYLTAGEWFRKGSAVGTVSLGGQIYCLGPDWRRQEVAITFDPSDQQLAFRAAGDTLSTRQPLKGLTPADLMGDLWPLLAPVPVQLALPFTWQDYRVIRLSGTLGI